MHYSLGFAKSIRQATKHTTQKKINGTHNTQKVIKSGCCTMLVFFSWVQNSLPWSFCFSLFLQFFGYFSRSFANFTPYLHHPCLSLVVVDFEWVSRYIDEYLATVGMIPPVSSIYKLQKYTIYTQIQRWIKIDRYCCNNSQLMKTKLQTFIAESSFYNAKTTAKTPLTH